MKFFTLFKQKPKVVPAPWEHKLKYVLYEEWSVDYEKNAGWVWKCSCGTQTPNPAFYCASEEDALRQFNAHRRLADKVGF